MKRVIHRLIAGPDLPQPIVSDKQLSILAQQLLPAGDAWRWNQALIEFGALQCSARKPACVICPLQSVCAAFPAIQSIIASLPVGVRKKNEAPFAGSNRYYRGRMVDSLRNLENSEIRLSLLGPLVRVDYSAEQIVWLRQLADGLERDGLIRIAEDRNEYSTESDADPLVSLP